MSALHKLRGDARGTTPLAPDDPRHGTKSSYTNHACRCEACRRANTETHRAWRHRTGFSRPMADYRAEISTVRPECLRCIECRQWLSDDKFPRCASNEHRRGRHEWCTACHTQRQRERRARLSETKREAVRAYDRERKRRARASGPRPKGAA